MPTKKQAEDMLVNLISQLKLTRQEYEALMRAVQVLKTEEKPLKKEAGPSK